MQSAKTRNWIFKFAGDTYLVVPAVATGTCQNEIDHFDFLAPF